MLTFHTTFLIVAVTGLLCAPAFAQTATTPAPHVPLQKTIGHGTPHVVPSLIVMNSHGASLQGGKLTLTGVAAAVGATAAAAAAPYYYGATCGYYPYPPCY